MCSGCVFRVVFGRLFLCVLVECVFVLLGVVACPSIWLPLARGVVCNVFSVLVTCLRVRLRGCLVRVRAWMLFYLLVYLAGWLVEQSTAWLIRKWVGMRVRRAQSPG